MWPMNNETHQDSIYSTLIALCCAPLFDYLDRDTQASITSSMHRVPDSVLGLSRNMCFFPSVLACEIIVKKTHPVSFLISSQIPKNGQ